MTEAETPRRLYSFAFAAMASLLPTEDQSPEAQFLRSHSDSAETNSQRLERFEHTLANPAPADRPLLTLVRELGLTPIELLATSVATAVETNLMCGRAIAHLQAPLAGSRPTLGLLATALAPFAPDANPISAILNGPAVESGLLQLSADGAPLAERTVSVPLDVHLALDADDAASSVAKWHGTTVGVDETYTVPLPGSTLAEAKKYAQTLAGEGGQALVLRSGSPAEAKAVACEIARWLDRRALFIEVDPTRLHVLSGLGPWLILQQMVPVFCFELGPGERRTLPALPHYRGPRLAICGPDGSLESSGDTVPSWTLGVAPKEERARLWEKALGNRPMARELASHRHGSGRIAQLGRLARRNSAHDGRARLRMRDIVAASWTSEGPGLESLTQPLHDRIPDEAFVMTPALRDDLNRLLLRCRAREDLVGGLGASASAKYRPGVKALFTGPSGTGKTLAAGWLATRLGLPLYRVDLASITSKYIGETEKNLAQLLARAEHAEVILLFDEADSMFGKRTDVKESNDRFANAQTNYLLQRIESFDGIVFLTSNSRARFDPAFFRRLDAIVEFPIPGPAERRSLWQSHLGTGHRLSPLELNRLSSSADLLGGNIRNAVLTAAVLAHSGNRTIEFSDILQALTDEYRKLGRQVPSDLLRSA